VFDPVAWENSAAVTGTVAVIARAAILLSGRDVRSIVDYE